MESIISFSTLENKRVETDIRHDGFIVYIAMEEGEISNFDLQTHDGQNVIYAAKTPEQSMACLKNPDRVNLFKAIVHPKVSKTIGYLPITHSRKDDYDIYVNNTDEPSIFLLKPNCVDVTELERWFIQNK